MTSSVEPSKEFDMTNKIDETDIEECGPMPGGMPEKEGNPVTMSVTLNASGEQHVQDLMRMMQLAGAKNAAPVADMHVGPMDKHDDMIRMMQIADEEVEEEWDNSPAEEYADASSITDMNGNDMHRKKDRKAIRTAQPALEATIKDQLWKALREK